jgi:hypothetical protein
MINKNLYKEVKNYQKLQIQKLLKTKYFNYEIRNIILKNIDIYGNYYSNSEILTKYSNKSMTYLIRNENNMMSLYKIYHNSYTNEYNCSFYLEKNIPPSFNNRLDVLYYGGELLIITCNNIIVRYNFLTSKWKKCYIKSNTNTLHNEISSKMKYVVHDDKLYVLYDYWVDEINTFTPHPLGIIIFLDDESFTVDFFDNKSMFSSCFWNYSLISYENKIWKIGGSKSNYKQIKDIYTFNFESGIWEKEAFKLNNYRENFKLMDNFKLEIIDGLLYAIGGDIIDSIFSIEKFDNVNRIWVMVTSYKLKYKSIFLCDNKVILITNNEEYYVYDIKNNTWEKILINKKNDDNLFKNINI